MVPKKLYRNTLNKRRTDKSKNLTSAAAIFRVNTVIKNTCIKRSRTNPLNLKLKKINTVKVRGSARVSRFYSSNMSKKVKQTHLKSTQCAMGCWMIR